MVVVPALAVLLLYDLGSARTPSSVDPSPPHYCWNFESEACALCPGHRTFNCVSTDAGLYTTCEPWDPYVCEGGECKRVQFVSGLGCPH